MRSDYAAGTRMLNDVSVDISQLSMTGDPFESDYADLVMSTYRRIADVSAYEPSKHEADPNVRNQLPLPQYFPFSTRDLSFIGRYMAGVGMILAELGCELIEANS